MRQFLVGTAICLLFPTGVWGSTEEVLTQPELAPAKTSFAYRARHGWTPLEKTTLSALWFSGDDRDLPRTEVAEPIVVMPAQSARPVPSRTALCGHAAVAATEHDLPVPFFANLIHQESGFKSHVVSSAGAQGIAQFMPRVARAYGLENPFEPVHALSASAKLLRDLLAQFGNIGLAAAAYNAGPRRVQDWMARRGKLPDETRNYVRNITGHPAERWARVNAKTEETHLPAHARCPGMPEIAVDIPEAAPVKVAKGKGKGKAETKVAAASKELPKELPKLAAAKAAGPKMPKSFTLAAAAPGKKVAVISNGKLQIMAPEKGAKPAATKIAAKDAKPASKSAAKPAAKPANKTKVAAKPAAKPAKSAKDQSKPGGKRVKVAAAR